MLELPDVEIYKEYYQMCALPQEIADLIENAGNVRIMNRQMAAEQVSSEAFDRLTRTGAVSGLDQRFWSASVAARPFLFAPGDFLK